MNYDEEDFDDGVLEQEFGVGSDDILLPAFVREFERVATEYSRYNNIPAIISYYSILGNIVQDMVEIPYKRTTIDTRVHFCWIQTARTGKTTLLEYVVKPLIEEIFKELDMDDRSFLKLADYNTASLVGAHTQNKNYNPAAEIKRDRRLEDIRTKQGGPVGERLDPLQAERNVEDANLTYKNTFEEWKIHFGPLHGNGLWIADEFESSGIFKEKNHKENMNVLLQTIMNNFHNGSNLYDKQLTGKPSIPLSSKFTIIASTYPPEYLRETVTKKGILQRFLCYIWKVPDEILTETRKEVISGFGQISENIGPPLYLKKGFIKIYEMLEERFKAVGNKTLQTIQYDPASWDCMENEYDRILLILKREVVGLTHREVIRLFEMNLMEYIAKLSVLSAITESAGISDTSKRWRVYPHHVLQGAQIVNLCYKALIEWLTGSIKESPANLKKMQQNTHFQQAYKNVLTKVSDIDRAEGDYIWKELILKEAARESGLSLISCRNTYKDVLKSKFVELKKGRRVFIKPKEEIKNGNNVGK